MKEYNIFSPLQQGRLDYNKLYSLDCLMIMSLPNEKCYGLWVEAMNELKRLQTLETAITSLEPDLIYSGREIISIAKGAETNA